MPDLPEAEIRKDSPRERHWIVGLSAFGLAFGLDRLKEELMKNGLKCGGTLAERAQRLFLLRDKTIDEIDAKYKPPVRKEKRR